MDKDSVDLLSKRFSFFILLIMVLIIFSPSFTHANLIEEEGENLIIEKTKNFYLFNVTGSFNLISPEPNTGVFKLYIHIPVSYKSHRPFAIYVAESNGNHIENFRINDDYPGPNSLLEISFKNIETTDPLSFYWTAPVLIDHKDYTNLPEHLEISSSKVLPNEVKVWLKSSDFIQENHPEIIAKAKEIIGNETNVMNIARLISDFIGKEIAYLSGGPQDALTTLQRESGVCTGKSNLATALFRAVGIPARVVVTAPTPHFLIEIYLHSYGWVRLEATSGEFPWEFHRNIISYCVYPEDETSTSVRNGVSPYQGAVLYYSSSNLDLIWEFDREKCNIMRYEVQTTQSTINRALELAENLWNNYTSIKNQILNQRQEKAFNIIIKELKKTELLFTSNKVENFLNKLNHIERLYEEFYTENTSYLGNTISTVTILATPIITLSLPHRRKNKRTS
ncbi:MAG: transglutaminase-like domain-containing protein [Candidatus Heimdallarchaeaceae archaeon]